MAVDTSIRFNSRNSYKVTSLVFCYPFGVQGQTHITHSFQAYATSSLSSATRAKTKFFDVDGALVSESSHAFAVTPVFEKIDVTVSVPATAVQAQLLLLQGGTDWWLAEPKSEYGESATPYTVNYTNQLTYITPTGIYTGMVTTGQIVVTGSVAQPDETLETRLVTINNGVINLSSTLSAKTTKITNEGVYTGEVVASQITAGYINVDRLESESITGAKLANATITNAKISSLHGSKITANSITADKINVTNLYVGRIADLDNPNNYATFGTISGVLGVAQSYWSRFSTDTRERLRIQLYGITATRITSLPYDGTGNNGTGSTIFDVGQNKAVLSCSDYMGRIEARYDGANNAIGVDSTGPYYVKSGAKTYF